MARLPPCVSPIHKQEDAWGNNSQTIYANQELVSPAPVYFAVFFAAATDSTISISPITLPFTVALVPHAYARFV